VSWIYDTNINHGMQKEFEVINWHAFVCVLNNLLLTYSYDYDINSHFEKNDT
jgi:hypothetical protein